jgi:hypothetical protein
VAVIATQLSFEPTRVWRLAAYITTAVVSTGTVVLQLLYRPTAGSSSGQVVLGSLNIPAGTAADKVIYKDITPYNLPAGSQLAYSVSTAAAGGGAAGAAIVEVLTDFSPEAVLNESKFVAST